LIVTTSSGAACVGCTPAMCGGCATKNGSPCVVPAGVVTEICVVPGASATAKVIDVGVHRDAVPPFTRNPGGSGCSAPAPKFWPETTTVVFGSPACTLSESIVGGCAGRIDQTCAGMLTRRSALATLTSTAPPVGPRSGAWKTIDSSCHDAFDITTGVVDQTGASRTVPRVAPKFEPEIMTVIPGAAPVGVMSSMIGRSKPFPSGPFMPGCVVRSRASSLGPVMWRLR
jgi:hypothetical protein